MHCPKKETLKYPTSNIPERSMKKKTYVPALAMWRDACLVSSIYKFGLSVCLFVCLFVCLYPINVKTAEPIGPKFFVGHHVIPGKVYG